MFCREHVAQLRDHEAELAELGARVAAIGMGDLEYARRFREDAGIGFPLLVDEKRRAYRAVRLRSASPLSVLSSDVREARRRAARAGHRQHRLGEHPLQLGGSFVFGPGDHDLFVHLASHFGDNAPADELVAVVRRATGSSLPTAR